jgi:hypothetical protein
MFRYGANKFKLISTALTTIYLRHSSYFYVNYFYFKMFGHNTQNLIWSSYVKQIR